LQRIATVAAVEQSGTRHGFAVSTARLDADACTNSARSDADRPTYHVTVPGAHRQPDAATIRRSAAGNAGLFCRVQRPAICRCALRWRTRIEAMAQARSGSAAGLSRTRLDTAVNAIIVTLFAEANIHDWS
jgi:hypothetical protein